MNARLAALAVTLTLAASACTTTDVPLDQRVTTTGVAWATPIELPGVPNLHRVDDGLYRSAQPTAEGMQNLDALGVRTVVNLRSFHTDDREAEGTSLDGVYLPMRPWDPNEYSARVFLRVIADPARRPVLVHCQHGADRTGALVAMYRVVVHGWSKDDALDEMTGGGFGHHAVWGRLRTWVRTLDVESLRLETPRLP